MYMLKFIKIHSVHDSNYEAVFNLYNSSFPPNERRSRESLEMVLNADSRFNVYALENEQGFVGFFNYWKFSRFYYIEHFAIHPQHRNHSYGSEVIRLFLSTVSLPVVLEVEMPKTITASRRIHFYERLGFYVMSNFYMQPPYDGESFLLPMLIMSNDYHFTNKHFHLIKEVLYKEVYNFELPLETK